MTDYDNNNRGALWKNDKRTTEKHPQLRGTAEVNGVEYWVSAWTSNEGGKKPVVSLSFQAKEEQPSNPVPAVGSPEDDFDDDLPF
jgi:hypothetical protein